MKRWNLVVGKSAKVLSVLLSVSMVCSMTAACGKKSEGAEPSAVIERLTGAAEDGEAESGETEGTESKDGGAEANDAGTDETGESADTASTDATVALLENAMYGEGSMKHHSAESGKSETVYVLSDADGAPHEVIVSDWLRNKDGAAQLKDESGLKDIKNVSGYETFEQSGDSLVWQADGSDIPRRMRLQPQLKNRVRGHIESEGDAVPLADPQRALCVFLFPVLVEEVPGIVHGLLVSHHGIPVQVLDVLLRREGDVFAAVAPERVAGGDPGIIRPDPLLVRRLVRIRKSSRRHTQQRRQQEHISQNSFSFVHALTLLSKAGNKNMLLIL